MAKKSSRRKTSWTFVLVMIGLFACFLIWLIVNIGDVGVSIYKKSFMEETAGREPHAFDE